MMPDPLAPEPPYPTDTRAKGMMFDIDVERLYQSKTWLIAPGVVKPWLLRLWVESWRSIPVGSYEDDDELLAARLDMPLELFQTHRPVLMRGWVRHRDGNLYHPQITAMVLKFTTWRDRERSRKQEWREKMSRGTDGDKGGTDVGQTGTDRGLTGTDGRGRVLTAVDDTSSSSSSSSPSSSEFLRVAKATVEFAQGEPDLARSKAAPPAPASTATQLAPKPGAPPVPAAVSEVFQHWQAVMRHPQARLDVKRRKAIGARLKEGYSVDQLKQAIDGCKASPWHQGQNDRHLVYDDIGLICRDAQRVEAFIARVAGQTAQQAELDSWVNEGACIEGECRHVHA